MSSLALSPVNEPAYSIIWKPQEGPQTFLISCPIFEVFYGGARGGGKTESSIGDWLEHSGRYGEDAIGIFVRRKLTQLKEVIARTQQLFPKLGARYNVQDKMWTMRNGARLKFVYLEKDADAEEYQGHSYTRVYVEEVTNFPTPDPINKLRATLRSGAGVPVGMRLTGNPGGAGHNWVKRRYIDPAPAGYQIVTQDEELEFFDPESNTFIKKTVSLSRVYIPSRLKDNALLMRNDPTYIIRLRQSGSAALVKAWLEGDWGIIDGAFFDNWDSDLIVRPNDILDHVPPHTLRFRSMDWGSARPFSVGWWAVSDGTWGLPKGALLRYREWYGSNGEANKGLKMDAAQVARGILKREGKEHITYGVADPSMWIRNGGPAIAETMMVEGVMFKKADNKREPGWQEMRRLIGGIPLDPADPLGQRTDPMLFVCECCEDSIRTIPTLQHDEDHLEDLDTEAEDHAADDWRYAVMSRPWVKNATTPKGQTFPKLPSESTFDDLLKMVQKRKLALKKD